MGIDIDEKAIEYLTAKISGADIRLVDAHRMDQVFDQEFDLIIAGDVIEHLSNPGIFLGACRAVMKIDATLIITTINAFGVIRFAKSILFHEAVHVEHTAYYSHKTLKRLLHIEGLDLDSAGYYRSEPISYGPSINRRVSNFLEHVACLVWPHYAEGLIVSAKKRNS